MELEVLQAQGKTEEGTGGIMLQVLFFEEDDTHFGYMPSLDLTGCGSTIQEAKDSLAVVFDEFLDYALQNNTLLSEMKRLGWSIREETNEVFAPLMSEMIATNEELREIINTKQYFTSTYRVDFPAFV